MYTVTIRDGKRVIEQRTYSKYDEALDATEMLVDKYNGRYSVEFKGKPVFA